MRWLFATDGGYSNLVLRLAVGVVMFAHGAQKVLGWFGGAGFTKSLNAFTNGMHLPMGIALLVFAIEFLGGLGLIVGLLSRIAALGVGVEMAVAVQRIHFANGFFMNWYGNQKGEGFEYHILVIAMCLAILFRGSGRLSLDRAIASAMGNAAG